MHHEELLNKLGALKDAATVERVYGQPQTVGQKMLIPVAQVRTGIGYGFGSQKTEAERAEVSEEGAKPCNGGGGGGGVVVRPVGVLEVTPETTQFIPIHVPSSPGLLFLAGLGLGLLLAGRRNSRHQNDHCED